MNSAAQTPDSLRYWRFGREILKSGEGLRVDTSTFLEAISHAEGSLGGELQHGSLALVDQSMPVVIVGRKC